MNCQHCTKFLERYSCNAQMGECDCPKCQGFCKCKEAEVNDKIDEAVRLLQASIRAGHKFVVCVEAERQLSMQLTNIMEPRKIAQMLGRFERAARASAKAGND